MIDTGRIAESLGWNPTDLNRNQALLRVASRDADHGDQDWRDNDLDGVVRTSNTAPGAIDKLTAQAAARFARST